MTTCKATYFGSFRVPVPAALMPLSWPSPLNEMSTTVALLCLTPTRTTSERSISAAQDESAITLSSSPFA